MKVTPVGDKALVKRFASEKITPGGIAIPNKAMVSSQRGTVIAVGKGLQLEDGSYREMTVKEGDTIIFQKGAGTNQKIDGEEFLIMSELEILAVVIFPTKKEVKKVSKKRGAKK